MTSEKRWAILRIVLGMAQMVGALAAVAMLLSTGVNSLSIGMTAVTAAVMLASVYLFRVRRFGVSQRES